MCKLLRGCRAASLRLLHQVYIVDSPAAGCTDSLHALCSHANLRFRQNKLNRHMSFAALQAFPAPTARHPALHLQGEDSCKTATYMMTFGGCWAVLQSGVPKQHTARLGLHADRGLGGNNGGWGPQHYL